MRTTLLGVGIIILLVGVIVLSISNQYAEKPVNHLLERVEDLPYGKWKISAELNKSEELIVVFPRPNLEGVPNGETARATIFVNISDPNDGNTTFQIDFTRRDFNVSLLSKTEGLIVDDDPVNVGGVTGYAGNYTAYAYAYARGLATYYYDDAVLPNLELYRVDREREYPQRGWLPVGVSLIVLGAFFSVWGARSSSPSKSRRRSRH